MEHNFFMNHRRTARQEQYWNCSYFRDRKFVPFSLARQYAKIHASTIGYFRRAFASSSTGILFSKRTATRSNKDNSLLLPLLLSKCFASAFVRVHAIIISRRGYQTFLTTFINISSYCRSLNPDAVTRRLDFKGPGEIWRINHGIFAFYLSFVLPFSILLSSFLFHFLRSQGTMSLITGYFNTISLLFVFGLDRAHYF